MFCMECGEKLPDKAKFCFSCGQKTERKINGLDSNSNENSHSIEPDDEIIEIKKESRTDLFFEDIKTKINKNQIKLRSVYKDLDEDEVEDMIIKMNFFDYHKNENGIFINDYLEETINGDNVIIDKVTNLMWQKSGSNNRITFYDVNNWLEDLNQNNYAGFNDWRLPTLEEGASLLESICSSNELHINSKFFKEQRLIWTGDSAGSGLAWCINFGGYIYPSNQGPNGYVRLVRFC